jgi:uncharacterized membrane protein YhhN
MKVTWLTILYAAAGICFIFADALFPESYTAIFTKALLMPLLLMLFLSMRDVPTGFRLLVALALVFSWIGDVALEFTAVSENFFLAGLGSFMLTQLLYVVIFAKNGKGTLRGVPLALSLLPVAVYGVALTAWLFPALGAMRVPVTFYAVVIHAMLALAVIRAHRRMDRSGWLVFAGAILFLLSDSLIAVSRFKHPFGASPVLIMVTYMTGQYLIIRGLMRQFQKT